MTVVSVGIAELAALAYPGRLRTAGLGSCVGIALYDRSTRVGGLAHIMLPDSSHARGAVLPGKFADTAVPELLRQMEALGARRPFIVAKLAGGAHMFRQIQNEALLIGARNVEAARAALRAHGVPIVAEDTGGHVGRTIELELADGTLTVRTARQEVRVL
ncbi:chemotaxis protein CheD [Hydrogenibacillus sp. N12]|uniref:chemotaxis protein CheD n=1 Tax=Hydrogenibacillus sp. N12 TaxID=2866627 RepID=UPI001C7D3B75|nr:chemotaxis protein CheD [Hydrogenibacillus sp. N12]QZA33521.1 chemotaxis protein CheD [Hydrogenibacillus sp. N12]